MDARIKSRQRVFLWIAVAALLNTGIVSAQLSPGALSRAHQQLEGVTQCTTCHNFGSGARALKCLQCHVEIQHRLAANTGYHARVVKQSANGTDCARCHLEHNGRDYSLIPLDRKTFNHAAETGFLLEGKHRSQACAACHNVKKIPPAVLSEIKLNDPGKSFLGLKRECTTCHEDQHRGQLGADCARCHNQDGWKPVTGFNHAQTRFPLSGLHQSVACSKCHAPQGTDAATLRFKGLEFSGCQNCHTDPHRGGFQDAKFRGGCESCHSTSGWKNPRLSSNFRHDQTSFPLSGKHTEVVCAKCHKDTDFHRAIPHERCQACHEDPHNGQFASRVAGSDCKSCHADTGFKPTLFDRVAHQKSAFPLEGKHSSLTCAKCHQPEGKTAKYTMRTLLCADCHSDPHGGEFAAAPKNNKCDLCHTQESFRPPVFTVTTHTQTRFPLTGKHIAVTCQSCHKPIAIPAASVAAKPMIASIAAPDALRQYHFPSQACNACHKDPHETKLTCETCHDTGEWKKTSVFDHSKTRFKIDAGHEQVACVKCHVPADRQPGGAPRFSGTPAQCGGCHEQQNVHGTQFRLSGREEDCSTCHTPLHWKNDAFPHETTRFPLDVAHRNVSCMRCHKQEQAVNGKAVRIYRDTPTECVRCH